MSINVPQYRRILDQLGDSATLVAVSKTKPVEDILALYELGHRDFGENYVQELVEKYQALPKDIRWHFIGHLQTNKVKYIAPFVHLVHGVDSLKLLQTINKEGIKIGRILQVLLQVYISTDETKFGFDERELRTLLGTYDHLQYEGVAIKGLMGMASFTEDNDLIRSEFKKLKEIFDHYRGQGSSSYEMETLSMGMSADYQFALEQQSNMVRIGSLLFGSR